jgi:cytochrome b pre-mRNA-processing protein 3
MAVQDTDSIHCRSPDASGSGPLSWINRLRGRWRREGSRRDAAHRLYAAAVEQSRQPTFYAAWGVPDSREGRLEMLNLHAMLLMRRLRSEGEEGRAVAQVLFDLMFLDLDRHLREWGVGDLSIGKHVKKLAQSFFGRAAALDPLLSSRDAAGIEDVLRRNVYTDAASPPPAAIGRLAGYLLLQEAWLAGSEGPAIVGGLATFAPPAAQS